MRLSKDFTLQELTVSNTAVKHGISNIPDQDQITNLILLCQFILQPIKEHFNKPVIINSGYRSPELCLLVNSTVTSQHTKGQAADFEINGVSNKELADWIVANLDYDQCILEFWNKEEPNSGWVHCSYSFDHSRKQYLKAVKTDKGTLYSQIS
jgi:zinc D-Ala-D-Ala carboxypeptidase